MPSNRIFRFGPTALTNTLTTNILTPAGAGSGTGYVPTSPYLVLRHVRVVNKTGASHTVSLWLGATGANAAGTEIFWQGKVVPANDAIDWYGMLRMDQFDYLVGGADANSALTIQGEGDEGIS